MADIFVSYTSKDRDWAFWIGQELLNLGHTPHVHEWEIGGGEDIYGWMRQGIEAADHMVCVTSAGYLTAEHSMQERNAALFKSAKCTGFTLIVVVRSCQIPVLFANLKRYEIHAIDEHQARACLASMFQVGRPAATVPFPGSGTSGADAKQGRVPFPGGPRALSNIPISVPRFFLGRDEVLAEIRTALASEKGRVANTALHGMRGVGKTTLAAAYAEFHRGDYRATWWIRAETESTLRADLAGLGVRLGWVARDEKEEPAIATVMERLRDEGVGILLVFDNAIDADFVEAYFPSAGDAQVLVTSNAHARGPGAAGEIRLRRIGVGCRRGETVAASLKVARMRSTRRSETIQAPAPSVKCFVASLPSETSRPSRLCLTLAHAERWIAALALAMTGETGGGRPHKGFS